MLYSRIKNYKQRFLRYIKVLFTDKKDRICETVLVMELLIRGT